MIHKNDPHISVLTNYSLAKIDARLLQSFLRDLLREASKSQEVTEDKLIEYTDTMVSSDLHKQTNTRWNWPGTDTNIAKGTMEPRVQCSNQSNFLRSFHNHNFFHKSWTKFSFQISTKASILKSQPHININIKILTNVRHENLNCNSASKS